MKYPGVSFNCLLAFSLALLLFLTVRDQIESNRLRSGLSKAEYVKLQDRAISALTYKLCVVEWCRLHKIALDYNAIDSAYNSVEPEVYKIIDNP